MSRTGFLCWLTSRCFALLVSIVVYKMRRLNQVVRYCAAEETSVAFPEKGVRTPDQWREGAAMIFEGDFLLTKASVLARQMSARTLSM